MPVRRRRSPSFRRPQGSDDTAAAHPVLFGPGDQSQHLGNQDDILGASSDASSSRRYDLPVQPRHTSQGDQPQHLGNQDVFLEGSSDASSRRQYDRSVQPRHATTHVQQSHEDASSSPPQPRPIAEPPRGSPETTPTTHRAGLARASSQVGIERDETSGAASGRGANSTSSPETSPSTFHTREASRDLVISRPRPRPPSILPSRSPRDSGDAPGEVHNDDVGGAGPLPPQSSPDLTTPPPAPRGERGVERVLRDRSSDARTSNGRGSASGSRRGVRNRSLVPSRGSITSNNNDVIQQGSAASSAHEPTSAVAMIGNALHNRRRLVRQASQESRHSVQTRSDVTSTAARQTSATNAAPTARPQNTNAATEDNARSAAASTSSSRNRSNDAAVASAESGTSRFFRYEISRVGNTGGATERNGGSSRSGTGSIGGSESAGGGHSSSTSGSATSAAAASGGGAARTSRAASTTSSAANRSGGEGGSRSSTTINQLHKASVVGDLTSISRFIKDGGDLEAQSFCGRTALHYAAFYGHVDVARALILGGAKVCSRGGGNSTPLHFAAWGGNKKVVRLLLDYGAEVEARDTEGNWPQAYSEDDELYEMLVKARRKTVPIPTFFLSRCAEARPYTCLTIYILGVVLIVGFASTILIVAINSNPGGRGLFGFTAHATLRNAARKGGGRAAVTATATAAAAAAGSSSYVGSMGAIRDVPISLLLAVGLPVTFALVISLAPAVVLAIGYRRRSDAYWASLKARDGEIVRLRHREQAAGGWLPAPGIQPASSAGGGVSSSGSGASGGDRSSSSISSPRTVSRGEQAGQAVLARLSRMQASSMSGGPGAGTSTGLSGGAIGAGLHQQHQQQQAAHRQQLEMRRYQQATGGSDGSIGGGGESHRPAVCVQVAQ